MCQETSHSNSTTVLPHLHFPQHDINQQGLMEHFVTLFYLSFNNVKYSVYKIFTLFVFSSKCLYVHTILPCIAVKYGTHDQYAYYSHQTPEYNISFSQLISAARHYNHGGCYLKFSLQKEPKTLHYSVK